MFPPSLSSILSSSSILLQLPSPRTDSRVHLWIYRCLETVTAVLEKTIEMEDEIDVDGISVADNASEKQGMAPCSQDIIVVG